MASRKKPHMIVNTVTASYIQTTSVCGRCHGDRVRAQDCEVCGALEYILLLSNNIRDVWTNQRSRPLFLGRTRSPNSWFHWRCEGNRTSTSAYFGDHPTVQLHFVSWQLRGCIIWETTLVVLSRISPSTICNTFRNLVLRVKNQKIIINDETTRIAVGIRLDAAICHPHTCPRGGLGRLWATFVLFAENQGRNPWGGGGRGIRIPSTFSLTPNFTELLTWGSLTWVSLTLGVGLTRLHIANRSSICYFSDYTACIYFPDPAVVHPDYLWFIGLQFFLSWF